MSKTRHRICWLVPTVFVALLGGCQTMPGAEAVLFGKWELTEDTDPNGVIIILVFDSFGTLIQAGTQTGRGIGSVTVIANNATGTVSVTDKSVSIITSTNVRFNGTFNADMTIAAGTLFEESTFFGTTTTTNLGPATLTKVP